MPDGSLYQLTHRQLLYDEPMLNVYHYLGVDANATADDLIDAFQAEILPAVTVFQSDAVTGKDITVISIEDFSDFAQQNDFTDGNYSAVDIDAAFIAVNITLRTNVRNIGPGSKRYSGLASNHITAGFITDAGDIAALNTLAGLLCDVIGTGANNSYQPVIVKRIPVAAVPGVSKAHYRMPLTMAEAEWAFCTTGLVNLKISHQVSRGNGR